MGSRYSWLVVAALSITVTTSYGVLSYAFAVLLPSMQRERADDARGGRRRGARRGVVAGRLAARALCRVRGARGRDGDAPLRGGVHRRHAVVRGTAAGRADRGNAR